VSVPEPRSRHLAPEEAKRFYDRLGSGQDWQRLYENPAISELIAHAAFDSAHCIRVRVWSGDFRRSPIAKISARRLTLCGARHQQHQWSHWRSSV
jgi:hypothetical protein